MATARQFSVLYSLVQTICGDLSSQGKAQAQGAINTVIKEINREFNLPEFFKGYDNSIFVTPTVGKGAQLLSLASDVVRLSTVWWVDNLQTTWQLEEIPEDSDWLQMTDMDSDGDPVVFRYLQPSSGSANGQLQIWTAPNAGWVSKSGGKMFYSYWSQFSQLVNDADIPNIPYELDTILVNGGVVEMARQQGDYVLLSSQGGDYLNKYEEIDKGCLRAWIIKQRTKDGQMQPDQPMGVFGRGAGARGYNIGSSAGGVPST